MPADHLVIDQRNQIIVEQVLLLVGQFLEPPECVGEACRSSGSRDFELVLERMAAGQLAENQRRFFQADFFGRMIS